MGLFSKKPKAPPLSELIDKAESFVDRQRQWLASFPWEAMRQGLPDLVPTTNVVWGAGGTPFDITDENLCQPHLRKVYPMAVDGMLPALVSIGISGTGLSVRVMGDTAGFVAESRAARFLPAVMELEAQGLTVGCRAFLTASPKGSISVKIDLNL